MKTTKGKKGGKKNRKSLARYKSVWVKGKKDKNIALIMEKPDAPTTPLKESAKVMKECFPHTYGDVIEPELTRKQERARAEVVPITKAKTLHPVTDQARASPDELGDQIAKLEAHINNAESSNKEDKFVGPPKPTLSVVQATPQVEDVGKSTPVEPVLLSNAANEPDSTHDNGDYNYEELAQLCDLYQIEIMQLKVGHKHKIDMLNEHITEMGKTILELQHDRRVLEFNAVSSESEDKMRNKIVLLNKQLQLAEDANFKLRARLRVAEMKLEEANKFNYTVAEQNERLRTKPDYMADLSVTEHDLANAKSENEGLRKEIDLLMYTVDQYGKQYKHEKSKSEATLKTLSNQFNIYQSQHRDDPVKNFLRYSGYGVQRAAELKKYFDDEAELRCVLSDERGVHRRWANTNHATKNAVTYERRALRMMGHAHYKRRLQGVTNEDVLAKRWLIHQEKQVLRGWGARRATPLGFVTEIKKDIFGDLSYFVTNKDKRLLRHEVRMWWQDHITPEEVQERYLKQDYECKLKALNEIKQSKLYKPAIAVVSFIKKVDDILETELSPTLRKQQACIDSKRVEYEERAANHRKANRKAKRAADKAAKIEASKIKRMLEQDDERSDMRDRILKRGAYWNT